MFQRGFVRSRSAFIFASASVSSTAGAVPTLLPASFPEACNPVASEFAEPETAALVSAETGGGGPLTGPVGSPTFHTIISMRSNVC